jgi:hypothetical protein
VIKGVLLQQLVQAVVAHALFLVSYWTCSSCSWLPFMFLCCVIVILFGVNDWMFLNIGFFLYIISSLFQFASWG